MVDNRTLFGRRPLHKGVMRKDRRRAALPRGGSALEKRFELYWQGIGGPALMREHGFHGSRKWRFDFAHLETRVAIELEGGSWSNGAHSRGAHFQGDCEKYNAAIMCGWRVFRLTGAMIAIIYLEPISKFITDRVVKTRLTR